MLRVAFVTSAYPPRPKPVADASHRLVCALDDAGVEIVVFARSYYKDPPMTANLSDRVRVYRVASDLERQALFEIEDRRPFDLLHAFTWPMAAVCLELPMRHPRPLVVSLREEDGAELREAEPGEAATPALASAAAITALTPEVLRRAVDLCGAPDRGRLVPDDDPRVFVELYGQLAGVWTCPQHQ